MQLTPTSVVVALSVQESPPAPAAEPAVRGQPGAALVSIDALNGSPTWRVHFDATEWAIIASLAVDGSDFVVGGSFAGTLRAGDSAVTSGGESDGFVAKIRSDGALVWLRRLGGYEFDSVAGVASHSGRIAIAGAAGADAELGGAPIAPRASAARNGMGFLALLNPAGDVIWAKDFDDGDAVAGIAIDSKFRIAIATTIAEPNHPGSRTVAKRGATIGLVRFVSPSGHLESNSEIRSSASVSVRSIVAVGERMIVGGVFSGTLRIGRAAFVANESGDAFLASMNAMGEIEAPWHVAGAGHEEIVSLASVPGGFIAGVSYTRGLALNAERSSPHDEGRGGSAMVVGPSAAK